MWRVYAIVAPLLSLLVYRYEEFLRANPTILGFSGLACSIVYRVPQIVKLYRTRGYKDLSMSTIHAQNLGYFFYLTYAYFIHDVVNIVASIISVNQNILLLVLIERGRAYEEDKQSKERARLEQGVDDQVSGRAEEKDPQTSEGGSDNPSL
jgi:uncharacterized protein with PQ loop repeat